VRLMVGIRSNTVGGPVGKLDRETVIPKGAKPELLVASQAALMWSCRGARGTVAATLSPEDTSDASSIDCICSDGGGSKLGK
jgi:hypothetical protein